jgi:energy-coupling factor transport system substrate-specific component
MDREIIEIIVFAAIGIALILALAFIASKKKLTVETLVATAIGAALFFVLGRFASFTVFANTYITFQYAILCFLAVVYGPIAGALIGLIGHALIDFTSYGPWWSWIIASSVVGIVVGCIALLKKIDVEGGKFGIAEIIWFNVAQIVANVIAWGGIAPSLDILIYSEPVEKIYTQGLIASIGNIVTTAVLGTILLFLYSKLRPAKGSLTKEADSDDAD